MTVGEKSDLFHGGVSDHSVVSEGSSLGGPANSGSHGDAITAVDEGVINPMTLATWVDDTTIDVTIINGREGRAIKRQRNKSVGQIQRKISRCKNGSRKHRRLVMARKKINGKTKLALRDFDHQVSRKAADHAISHNTGRLVFGDVCCATVNLNT